MDKKLISTTEAIKIAKDEYSLTIQVYTIRSWCEDFGIGKKVGGRWFVDKEKLKEILRGDVTYETQGRPAKKAKNKSK